MGSGNTELFTKDILSLDKSHHDLRDAVVDLEGNLISRPRQLEFDLSE